MLLTRSEVLTEVRNYSDFFSTLVLSKESVSTAVACVYIDHKRLVEPEEINVEQRQMLVFDGNSVLFSTLVISQRLELCDWFAGEGNKGFNDLLCQIWDELS